MFTRIQDLYKQGIITSSQGTYFALPDFNASWAQRDYYDWESTGHSPANFVIQANIEWESASMYVDAWDSGCGYVFRMNARGDHYLAYLSLDGWFTLYTNLDKTVSRLGRLFFGTLEILKGQAMIAIAADGDLVTFFVNNNEVGQIQDKTFTTGLLGYALASGTNTGFGTRCHMTNVELWEIAKP